MDSTRLYLVRHGQVVGHDEYRYNGHSDVDITDTGLEQMERMAEFLSRGRSISAVYSSDLIRASKGAEIISKRLGLLSVRLVSLRELNLGRWEGLTGEEAAKRYPEEAGFSFKDLATRTLKEGEGLRDLRKRVLPAVEEIIKRHWGGSVCIVAHGGVNRVILSAAAGMPLRNFFMIEQDYGCLNVIDYFKDGVKVVKLLNGGPNQELNPVKLY